MRPPSNRPHSILGISFDGLAISGIVNEFLNVASVLRGERLRVLIDLGHDITLGRTRNWGAAYLPSWVEPIRCLGDTPPSGYCTELVERSCRHVKDGASVVAAGVYAEVCNLLEKQLVGTFARQSVRLLVVENGTLPDNPIFTEALYRAIATHGVREGLGKYVLWRDHDLMWSAEPQHYGSYPYPGVRKPIADHHIHHAVSTEWMRKRMLAWAPASTYHVIPNRFFASDYQQQRRGRSIRGTYGIPQDAYLIARCTRVVPQKSIERDLHLLEALQKRLAGSGSTRRVFLFVTGPTEEDPDEFARLRAIEQMLSIAGQVVWGDGLIPFSSLLVHPATQDNRFSVRDLLMEADLSSFLTTYDYEGFGNPPGEAMATGVAFISTTYELYHEVYGSKGAVAPLLAISRSSSPEEPIPDRFVDLALRLLSDHAYREQVVRRNLAVCQRFFSLTALQKQMTEIFGPMPDLTGPAC